MYTEDLKLFINGQWRKGSDGVEKEVINPATGETIASLPSASADDLDEALDASDRSFRSWKRVSAADRWAILSKAADLIEARSDSIARTLTMENGKPLAQAKGEVGFCADATRWYAEEGKRAYGRIVPSRYEGVRQLVTKEPVGPALGFAAWNFPAGNVTLKIAAALAAGCSIIVKPSDETPGTAVAIGRCFEEAGVPAGLINIVFGNPAPISERLIASPIPKKVSLTGSTPVGKLLQRLAADTLKRCTMELGGHAPVLVFPDADIDRALDRLVAAKFRNAGQVCTAPTRFFLHESISERFVDGFIKRASALKIGNGLDEGTQMGPMITARKQDEMDAIVANAKEKGADVRLGGERLGNRGYFFSPTVLTNVPDDAKVMTEEPFGPVAPMTTFRDFDEVVVRANALRLGLAAYAFTASASISARVSEELDAGCVGINHTSVHEAETPFGGVNESGYGAESGSEGLDAYLRTKFVSDMHTLA